MQANYYYKQAFIILASYLLIQLNQFYNKIIQYVFMKAIMKGKASQFFKKQPKKQIDQQQVVNQIQAKAIAKIIGIQQQQIKNFDWFFQQVLKVKLPKDIQRYLDQQTDKIVYEDAKGNKTQIHPQIDLLKIFFYQSLSQKKIQTFQIKKQKLLPFVEQKMMKQCVAISSKRREVQKVNLQRDQNGKMVLSKMARVTPDIKSLISARSYMLKMLVQKVYTRKQIWGKGKKANVYANILNEKYKNANPQIQEEVIQTDQSLQFYQTIFHQAYQFYQEQYGELATIPKQIAKSKLYKKSTPENILRNIFILGISKYNIQFYWLARLMDSLKLPHNWSRKIGKVFDTYTYEPKQLVFDVHPGYIYIFNQMNSFREFFNGLSKQNKYKYLSNRQMKFFDFFERAYTVDMYGLIQKEEYKIQIKNKKTTLFRGNSFQKQQNFNDWMIIQGIRNSSLKQFAYPLIGSIQTFWRKKFFNEEQWGPSVSPFGDVVWSSMVNNRSINYCPYKQSLLSYIAFETQNLPKLEYNRFRESFAKNIIIQNDKIRFKQDSKSNQEEMEEFHFIEDLKQDFLKYYISHVSLPTPVPYAVQNHFGEEIFFDQIFTSQFCFDQGIQFMEFQYQGPLDLNIVNVGQENVQNLNRQQNKTQKQSPKVVQQQQELSQKPIWLQKVRAKFYIVKMKNKLAKIKDISNSKTMILQNAVNYVTENQPGQLELVYQLIRKVRTKQDLIIFIQEVYDVEAREKRKTKYKQSLNQQVQDDDDIFGSDISNIEIQDAKVDSEHQNSSSIDDNQKQSEKSQQEQFVSESSGQSQVQKQEVHQDNLDELQLQQAKQYSFLIDNLHYQTSPYYQNADEQTLDLLLKKKIKNKLKKYKFSQKYIKDAVKQFVKLRQNYQDLQTVRDIKKNLIITDLKAQTLPYKNLNIIKFQRNQISKAALENMTKKHNSNKIKQLKQRIRQERDIFTPADLIDRTELFRAYQSEMDDYSADEIIQNINSIKARKLQQERAKQLQKSQQKKILQEPNINDQTKQSIVLQPIMRIKPDIAFDPFLRHISLIQKKQQVTDFRKTFTKFQKPEEFKIKKRTKSCQKLPKNTEKRASNNQTNTSSTLNKQKLVHVSSFTNVNSANQSNPRLLNSIKSMPKSQILALSGSNNSCFRSTNASSFGFNRVCLGNTASNFLKSQSVRTKGQLVVIQARKSLIGKGRGLATYMSKKY